MKIVDVCEFYSERGGGVRSYVHQKLEALSRLGCEPVIIAPGTEDRRRRMLGGEIITVRSPSLPLDHRYCRFSRAEPIHELLDSLSPDVVEASSPWRGAWIVSSWSGRAARSLFLHQDPVAVYPHSVLSPRLNETRVDQLFGWFWSYLRQVAMKFDQTVVSSRWFAGRILRHCGLEPVVLPLGVDRTVFYGGRRCETARLAMLNACGHADPEAILFIAVSRFHPEKRLHMMMDAFEIFGAKRKAGLYIIGDGPTWRSVRRRAERSPHIRLAGVISDRAELAKRLASADYFLHAGAAETFGLAVAEALASGLPLVAPHLGGAAEIAHPAHSETYRAGDMIACAAAMARICSRDREALSAAARVGGARLATPSEHFEALVGRFTRLRSGAQLAAA